MNRYESVKVIGRGTYGEVWLVRLRKDKRADIRFVLKSIDLRKASAKERGSAEQEAMLLKKLRHPNIVSYKDSFMVEGKLSIVMSYCEGGDLYSKLKKQKKQPLEETVIVNWFIQITMAIQYLHQHHVLHRDLKTQNIFLTKSSLIKVGDLGIARKLEMNEMAHTVIGTPYYMSPEIFANKPYSYASDIWSLGCVLYELASLKHAFNAKDLQSLVFKVMQGGKPNMPENYSRDLIKLIEMMLNLEPTHRPTPESILHNAFIKTHIIKFLQSSETNSTRKKPPAHHQSTPEKKPKVEKPSEDECDFVDNGIIEKVEINVEKKRAAFDKFSSRLRAGEEAQVEKTESSAPKIIVPTPQQSSNDGVPSVSKGSRGQLIDSPTPSSKSCNVESESQTSSQSHLYASENNALTPSVAVSASLSESRRRRRQMRASKELLRSDGLNKDSSTENIKKRLMGLDLAEPVSKSKAFEDDEPEVENGNDDTLVASQNNSLHRSDTGNDVTEFYTLLHTTLQANQPIQPPESPKKVNNEFSCGQTVILSEPSHHLRARSIRSQLEEIIEPNTIDIALDILNSNDDDSAEDVLKDVLGEDYDICIAKIVQLRLIQSL